MQCHEFEQVLEERMGKELPADAAAHLNDCAQCRAVVSDLEAIESAALRLSTDEVEPPPHIWPALRAQLESEGLIRTPGRRGRSIVSPSGWLGNWWDALSRPALAGAYLTFLLAAAMLVGLVGHLRQNRALTSRPAEPPAAFLDTQLITEEHRTVFAIRQHDPAVTDSLRENLEIVDNFIALCEKSVREEPQNEMAREYLYGAYQQKAELLAMVMDRDALGN
jgi:hypothetical protein